MPAPFDSPRQPQARRIRWIGAATLLLALTAVLCQTTIASASTGAARRLTEIVSGTGKVGRSIAVGQNPLGVAVSQNRVWTIVRGANVVSVTNRTTGKTTRIRHVTAGQPISIAARGSTAYVLDDGDQLGIVRPGHTPVVTHVTLSEIVGDSTAVAAGGGGIWVVYGDSVARLKASGSGLISPPAWRVHIPAHDNEMQARHQLNGIVVTRHAVWVIGDAGDRRLWRLDADHPHITATTGLGFAPAGVAAGLGGIWVTDQLGDRLVRFDPGTARMRGAVGVGRDPLGVAVGATAVWVANALDGTLSKVDPHTMRQVAQVHAPGSPDQVAAGAGSVWVTTHPLAPAGNGGGIRIGVVTVCTGGFSEFREQTIANAELPLLQRGAKRRGGLPSAGLVGASVGGRPVTFMSACEAFYDFRSSITAIRTLVDRRHADVVLGSESDGVPVKAIARRHPHKTFVATDFDQSTTLRDPVANVYRFEADATQWYAGLGTYAYKQLGWRTAATVSNADRSSWPLVQAFDAEFCSLGGSVPTSKRIWVDISNGDDLGNHLPTGVDGVWLPGGGLNGPGSFVAEWSKQHSPIARHLLVGWPVLGATPDLVGVVGSSSDPYVPTPAFSRYLNAYATAFPGHPDPGLNGQPYYDGAEPVLEALAAVHGDLSHGQTQLHHTLARIHYHAPAGLVTLDRRHQAIVPIYIARVVKLANGSLGFKHIRVIKRVDQTFGGLIRPSEPPPSITAPACRHGNPPPWSE